MTIFKTSRATMFYLLRNVIPHLLDAECENDSVSVSLLYGSQHGPQRITVTLTEFEQACSQCNDGDYGKALLDKSIDTYVNQCIDNQYVV